MRNVAVVVLCLGLLLAPSRGVGGALGQEQKPGTVKQAPAIPAQKTPGAAQKATGAAAQKPPGAKKPQKRPPAAKPAAKPPAGPSPAAQAADRLRPLMRFLYLYGRISVGMESAAAEAQRGEASPAAIQTNKQNQARIVQNIAGLRAGMEQLGKTFAEDPATAVYLPRLSGAAATVRDAEQLAAAGKFDEAGRTLVTAAERLIELLRDMK